jgi:hypothetical protein
MVSANVPSTGRISKRTTDVHVSEVGWRVLRQHLFSWRAEF